MDENELKLNPYKRMCGCLIANWRLQHPHSF